MNDEVGHIIWHVKQLDDGTSWLASDKEISQIERHRVLPEDLDIDDKTVSTGAGNP